MFNRSYTATLCGHRTKIKGDTSAFNVENVTEMPLIDGKPEYCLECIRAMAIRCAWCGLTIFVGDPITLYTPQSDFKLPDYATIYSDDPIQLVGCARWNCADTAASVAGQWLPDEAGNGYVRRQPTVFEQMLGGSGGTVALIASSDPEQMKMPKTQIFEQ